MPEYETESRIAAFLSRSQRRQMASLLKRLAIYGAGELELVYERKRPRRYQLHYDPLLSEIRVEAAEDEYADAWPWWVSIAQACATICQSDPGYGSVHIQVEGGGVRSVRTSVHIPSLPPSGELKNGLERSEHGI